MSSVWISAYPQLVVTTQSCPCGNCASPRDNDLLHVWKASSKWIPESSKYRTTTSITGTCGVHSCLCTGSIFQTERVPCASVWVTKGYDKMSVFDNVEMRMGFKYTPFLTCTCHHLQCQCIMHKCMYLYKQAVLTEFRHVCTHTVCFHLSCYISLCIFAPMQRVIFFS